MDVRDSLLQVEQDEKVLVHLQNEPFIIVMRNLPGQRVARQWYLHLRKFLEKTWDLNLEQPSLAHTRDAAIMIHVDDFVLYVGTKQFWDGVFLKKTTVTASHEQIGRPRQ